MNTVIRREPRHLYLVIAIAMALVGVFGFTRTYWAPLATGSVRLHPVIHLHAVLFFAWLALVLAQAVLPLRGRVGTHRQLGLLGIALAAAMVCTGLLANVVSLKVGLAGPRPMVAHRSAALGFGGMLVFAVFVSAGIANVRRPEVHKRWMVMATFGILQAAIARWIMLIPAISQPTRILIGALIVDAMILAVALVDARARGRVHPVYVAGLAFLVFVQWARTAVIGTPAWLEFTAWLVNL